MSERKLFNIREDKTMYKDSKWAKQIISLQDEEGKWGIFHSMSQPTSTSTYTTEQALRRLERLGYTMEDECIQKAVSYMNDCLTGKKSTPDYREKKHDWDIFTALMLATWIRRFTLDNPAANKVVKQWADVITSAFSSGTYHYEEYVNSYYDILGMKPGTGSIVGLENFYPISLVSDSLDKKTEQALVDHIVNGDSGIYYIYDSKLSVLPQAFESKNASRYLAAIELLVKYKHAKYQLNFVADWLKANRKENGRWDMGKTVNDKLYFPLSDDWRKGETREADCTERITKLLTELLDA